MKITSVAMGGLVCLLGAKAGEVDFNRDIRPILSNHCLACHGPDGEQRKAGLRLDLRKEAIANLGGYSAIVPEKADESEMIHRVNADDSERMPPKKSAARLSQEQISLLKRWIDEGAKYDLHWAYALPKRPRLPDVKLQNWARNPIDRFVLKHLERRGKAPSREADAWTLARRAAIDLTGLPPAREDLESFLKDSHPNAFERFVDRLLAKPEFGERWARVWLDLARYADSAGYADDPPRTIWAYRDYVMDALNANMPFDQFTIEQLAGDLLPNPNEAQLVATAFHRNTMTNNEGGTNDEQFRNEAIVDRVNTTMQVWMGTTMACAQCHTHKFDPITQREYFEFFAFFNNTEDNDQRNEEPTLRLFTEAQKRQAAEWRAQIANLKSQIARRNDRVDAEQRAWEKRIKLSIDWRRLKPSQVKSEKRDSEIEIDKEGVIQNVKDLQNADPDFHKDHDRIDDFQVYELRFSLDKKVSEKSLTGLRLQTFPQNHPFDLREISASWKPISKSANARFLRIELPGENRILSLAEVEVFSGKTNLAMKGEARQSSTASGGVAARAIDGKADGDFAAQSTTHTARSANPWWELDFGKMISPDRIVIWNRTDGGEAIGQRLSGFQISLLDESRAVIWREVSNEIPKPSLTFSPDGKRILNFLKNENANEKSVFKNDFAIEDPHEIKLIFANSLPKESGELTIRIRKKKLDTFWIDGTNADLIEKTKIPEPILKLLAMDPEGRNVSHENELSNYFRNIAPCLEEKRGRLAGLEAQLKNQKPFTTVPILRELPKGKRRQTHIQLRGNYLDKTSEVWEKVPAVFHSIRGKRDRLALAKWLVSFENPLTARVIANRHWEQLFGHGIVKSSEEFGSQGELPTHPFLLDWLAMELMESGWDLKHLIKTIVTSSTYCQESKITAANWDWDPDNRWYGRGPRFRLSAEMIRDQALFVGGLLMDQKGGAPARPMQPSLGLSAAFGSGIDWETSQGADRYRRGIYTQWRRSNPYPSMIAFDAPSREVCTLHRPRSNTPLQALVTLNDPVYVEAAQGFARRIVKIKGNFSTKMDWAFQTALTRLPKASELVHLSNLFQSAKSFYDHKLDLAKSMATDPLGEAGVKTDWSELAAWTIIGNVLLNLDEMFLKR